MYQQNQTVQNIINNFISKSRKNSLSNPPSPHSSSPSYSYASDDFTEVQQFTIRRQDLRQFIQKIATEKDDLTHKLEQKTLQLKLIKQRQHELSQAREEKINPSSTKEIIYLKHIQELESRLQNDKKRKEQQQKQVRWSQAKIKDHLMEIQRLKQIIVSKQNFIKKQATQNKIKQTHDSLKQSRQEFSTPAKIEIKKLQMIPAVVCQSIESKQSTIILSRNKEHPTDITKDTHRDQLQSLKISGFDPQSQLKSSHKFYRHSDLDKKEMLLRKLGQKCLFLESHIDKLTKKLLGYIDRQDQPMSIPVKMTYSSEQHNRTQNSCEKRQKRQILTFIEDEKQAFNMDID